LEKKIVWMVVRKGKKEKEQKNVTVTFFPLFFLLWDLNHLACSRVSSIWQRNFQLELQMVLCPGFLGLANEISQDSEPQGSLRGPDQVPLVVLNPRQQAPNLLPAASFEWGVNNETGSTRSGLTSCRYLQHRAPQRVHLDWKTHSRWQN